MEPWAVKKDWNAAQLKFSANFNSKIHGQISTSEKCHRNKTCKLRQSVSQLKSPIAKLSRSSLIYQITCSGCNALYVGQTGRHLITRLQEHGRKGTPVAQHFTDCQVPTSKILPSSKILDSTSRSKLTTLESIYISKLRPQINNRDEFRSKSLMIRFASTRE